MVSQSLDTVQAGSSSPRISFSADFLDDALIAIDPSPGGHRGGGAGAVSEFEFLSGGGNSRHEGMITADELFFEGKLLPFWQAHHAERLGKISLGVDKASDQAAGDKASEPAKDGAESGKNPSRVISSGGNTSTWFVDDDPSPRPPKCTVLWKELLRLKKQRATSTLSPSSSSSSSSSSASSLADAASADEGSRHGKHHHHHHHQSSSVKGSSSSARKGLERTRSATIRIRPMINVPICTQVKSTAIASSHHHHHHHALPPLFPLKKGKLER